MGDGVDRWTKERSGLVVLVLGVPLSGGVHSGVVPAFSARKQFSKHTAAWLSVVCPTRITQVLTAVGQHNRPVLGLLCLLYLSPLM